MRNQGCFITFEGVDGSGKSTQVKKLYAALQEAGLDVLLTREVGGTEEGEQIRNLLFQSDAPDWDHISEVQLISAARREHLVKKIWPALGKGQIVISDRFADSTRVFQGNGHGVALAVIDAAYEAIAEGFKPDLTFVFDLPVETGLARSLKHMATADGLEATEDKYEKLGVDFHQRVRQGYQDIAALEPDRCVVIDAAQDIETIHQAIVAEVKKRFDIKDASGRDNGDNAAA